MQASLWRKLPALRNQLSCSPHSSLFHSTSISLAKWKSKDMGGEKKPSKAQIRFAVRQNRADRKKALKDFYLYGKLPKQYPQGDGVNWWADENSTRNAKAKASSHDSGKFSKSKSSGNSESYSSSAGSDKRKRWQRKQRFYDVDVDESPESFFEGTFGGQKCYTWSFTWTENLNFSNTRRFDFGGESRWEKARERVWTKSDDEDESTVVGCHSDRITLGLPPTGPINLDEVKCAFRASALKWHPDKHQGTSQTMAEEKFKLCVNAYNSLCSVLRAA